MTGSTRTAQPRRVGAYAAGALAVLLAASAAPAASAASLSISTACVVASAPRIEFSVSGFTADAMVSLYDNTDFLDVVTVGGDGGFAGGFQGRHSITGRETRTLTAADAAGNTASGTYQFTDLAFVQNPAVAKKPTSKVAYAFDGFIGGGTLYAHYTFSKSDTKKIPAKTVALGTLEGPCGALITKKVTALPVKKPKVGVYEIQFDTSKAYKRQQGVYLETTIYVPKTKKK